MILYLALAAQQQQVTEWPQRLALTVALVVVLALACWGMWRSWRKRSEQALPVVTAPPDFRADLQVRGRYVGTSPAEDWMQRVLANGMGAPGNAFANVGPAGILLTREGEPDIFIDAGEVTGAEIGRGVAAQVAEKDGLVLWSWNAGDAHLATGFRPEAPEDVVTLVRASEQFVVQEEA